METAKIILAYLEAIIWPAIFVFVIYKFNVEIKAFFSKALKSHKIEVDILGQKIKLTAMKNLTENTREGEDVQNKMMITGQHLPYDNSLLTLQLLNKISSLTNDEAYLLLKLALDKHVDGYAGCEAERLVLENLVENDILVRDERGFYHATDDGQRILLALKTSNKSLNSDATQKNA